MTRIQVIAVSNLLALCLAASAVAAPRHPPQEHDAAVNQVLEGMSDKTTISGFVGATPYKCIQSAEGIEICEWRLDKREAGWKPLAAAIETTRRVVLLCALPVDGRARLKSSCVVRPQKSNRKIFSLSQVKKPVGVKKSDIRGVYQRLAQSWIDESLTMVSLSFLLGALPSDCASQSNGFRSCRWDLDASSFGHGTVVTALGVRSRDRVRLTCELPADGSPRAVEACQASIDE